LSTVASGGWVHSVPVHFVVVDDSIRIIAERGSVKAQNVSHDGPRDALRRCHHRRRAPLRLPE
jgi:hypothetical protein